MGCVVTNGFRLGKKTFSNTEILTDSTYWGADKSLAWPGRKQAQKHVRDTRNFNNIETWVVIKSFFLQGKVLKEIHAILTETLACFIPRQAKDLSAPLYKLNDTLCTVSSWKSKQRHLSHESKLFTSYYCTKTC